MTKRDEFIAGAKAVAPILVGAAPFGLVTGLTAVTVGLNVVEAVGMSGLVIAGASQLAALQLLGAGAGMAVIWFTVFVINLRHMMYSASIAPHFRHLSWRWRLFLPFIMTDQAYALSIISFEQNPENRLKQWYYLGAGLPLAVLWVILTGTGVYVGALIPPEWQLDFVIPLVFLVLVFPSIKDSAGGIAAVTAGVTAVVAQPLPYNLGLVLAAIMGIFAGVIAENAVNRGTHG